MKMEYILYKILYGLLYIVGLIPLPLLRMLGYRLGRLLYRIDKRHRHICIQNLSNAYYEEKILPEITTLAVQVFENLGQIVFEIAWSLSLKPKDLPKYFEIDGAYYLMQLVGKRQGAFILTAHIGNWELLRLLNGMLNFKGAVVYRPLDFKPLERVFQDIRTDHGTKIIPLKKAKLQMVRSVYRGEFAALLMDQNVDWYEGFFADFFGSRACTNWGLARLAVKTKIPIIPIFLVRNGAKFKFIIDKPFYPYISDDTVKDLEYNTAYYNRIIESIVRKYPAQWFWVHQRWKTKPYCLWPRRQKKTTKKFTLKRI